MILESSVDIRIFLAMKSIVKSVICAWCPGFVPKPGESHGICPSCAAKFDA